MAASARSAMVAETRMLFLLGMQDRDDDGGCPETTASFFTDGW